MKIKEINEHMILFDSGATITYAHDADCCEWNYADFAQLDDVAKDYDFDENLIFEKIEKAGFRFGDTRQMFFVPCYSEQNGYYSFNLDIFFNNHTVLCIEECDEIYRP